MKTMPYHQQVANKIIHQLKAGRRLGKKPWKAGLVNMSLPMNPVTGKRYKGINSLYLMASPYEDRRWLTYKQAQSMGAQVRKGEKATTIKYWKFTELRPKKDEKGNLVLDAEGAPISIEVKLESPRAFYAAIFNAEQINGLPEQAIPALDWDPIEKAESIVLKSGATIHHGDKIGHFINPQLMPFICPINTILTRHPNIMPRHYMNWC